MTTFLAVIEDSECNVIGASVLDGGLERTIHLGVEEIVPRSQLAACALTLATKYGVDPASFTLPAAAPNTPPPAPE